MRVGLSFDLRNPDAWHRPWVDFYRATLDLIVEAERLGIDAVKVTEHHLFDDGYMPQPLTFMAAIAARTDSIRMATGILQAPLHAAVDIAEQAAVVDCLSGGRVELALGTGYRLPEYKLYGVDMKQRLALYEDRVSRIRSLWGEGGVTPRPVQDPIPMWAGLGGARGSRLAGRLGMGRLHLGIEHWPDYLAGLEEGGHDPACARLGGSLHVMLADDPDRAFDRLAPRIEHNRFSYAAYGAEGTARPAPVPLTTEELRELVHGVTRVNSTRHPGSEVIVGLTTPDSAAQEIRRVAAGRPLDIAYLPATVSGVVDELAHRNVELIATELKPLVEHL